MKRTFATLAAALGCAAAVTPAGASTHDTDMLKLASNAGCIACHRVERGDTDGRPPIGPAWKDVTDKYKGQKGAAAKLTDTVLTGSSPYDSHWKGKVSGYAMPPNAVEIKEADAKKLVNWILSLDPK